MLTIRIVTQFGEAVQLQVQQAEFVRECPYCKLIGEEFVEFRTVNPDQRFCSTNHRINHFRKTHGM